MIAPYKQHVQPEFDSQMDVYRTTHDDGRPWPASTTTVLALADLTGVNPTDMLPLAGAVDPDTLNAHVQRNASDAELSFEYHGYGVTVRGNGCIEFEPVDGQGNGVSEHSQFDQQRTRSTHVCE